MIKLLLWLFVRIPLIVLSTAIFYLVITMIAVPIYDIEPSEPFEGKQWHNPYQDCDSSRQLNANFHAHSNAWGVITNGRDNSPAQVRNAYKRMGFDIIGISDYQSINTYRSNETSYIPMYEHGYNFAKAHQQSLGAHRTFALDVMLLQNIHAKQFIIDRLKSRCQLLVLNHPQKWGGYSLEELSELSNYDLIEVLNHYGHSEAAWDAVLSAGKRVYIIGNDDSHDVSKIGEVGRCFTRVLSESTHRDSVLKALGAGQAYGVDMPLVDGESFPLKATRISYLPKLISHQIVKDTLMITFDKPPRYVQLLGDQGKEIALLQGDTLRFALKTYKGSYLRAKAFWANDLCYLLNPVIRYDEQVPDNQPMYSMNIWKTWGIRLLVATLVFMVISIIRQIRRHKRKRFNPRW